MDTCHERVLLIKYGHKFGLRQKRYCQLNQDRLLVYFKSRDAKQPKSSFKIKKVLEFSTAKSFLKDYENCFKVRIIDEKDKNRDFWLFPVAETEKSALISNLIEPKVQNVRATILKKHSKSQKFLLTPREDLVLSETRTDRSWIIEGSNAKKSVVRFDNEALLLKTKQRNETLLDDGFDLPNYEEITLEEKLPEVWELPKGKHPHEEIFKEAEPLLARKNKKRLEINSDEILETSCNGKENKGFLNLIELQPDKKAPGNHKFQFPKREDALNAEILLNLDFGDEFLLKLAQQFLWEFQLENAQKIFLLRPNSIDYAVGLLEISLMKVFVSGKKNLIEGLVSEIGIRLGDFQSCDHNFMVFSELYLIKGMLNVLLQAKFQAFLALKESYNFLRKAEKSPGTLKDPINYSRFLLISGAFKIGFSLLPSQYRKILEIIGLATDRGAGIKALKECINHSRIRANYARLLLGLYFIEGEGEGSFDEAFELIKDSLKYHSKSPLINWLASLFSWRFMQGSESLKLIFRSLSALGSEFSTEAYYLKFELAWFELSRCQWSSALLVLEELAIVSLDLFNFDEGLFNRVKPKFAPAPLFFSSLISRALKTQNKALETYPSKSGDPVKPDKGDKTGQNTIIMPHKQTLILLIAICYGSLNETQTADYWFSMSDYVDRKFGTVLSNEKEIRSLMRKYRKRKEFGLLKYEVLYFLKEVAKLKEAFLRQIERNIEELSLKAFGGELRDHGKIVESQKKGFLSINEYASALFIEIIIHCLLRNFAQVLEFGARLKSITQMVSKDAEYLLHHGFHWVGRSLLINENRKKASEYLKLSQKYQDCDFSLRVKNGKLLKEMEIP